LASAVDIWKWIKEIDESSINYKYTIIVSQVSFGMLWNYRTHACFALRKYQCSKDSEANGDSIEENEVGLETCLDDADDEWMSMGNFPDELSDSWFVSGINKAIIKSVASNTVTASVRIPDPSMVGYFKIKESGSTVASKIGAWGSNTMSKLNPVRDLNVKSVMDISPGSLKSQLEKLLKQTKKVDVVMRKVKGSDHSHTALLAN